MMRQGAIRGVQGGRGWCRPRRFTTGEEVEVDDFRIWPKDGEDVDHVMLCYDLRTSSEV